GVAAGIADRVIVMYGGLVVEHAGVEELFADPQHPYTRALLDSLPGRHAPHEMLRSIAGQPPLLLAEPASCPFAPRCGHALARCWHETPPLIPVGEGHAAACWWNPDTGGRRDAA